MLHRFPGEVVMCSRVVVYTVAGDCPLCKEALHHLRALEPVHGFDLRVVRIDDDPMLSIRHALRVPVIEIDGREVLYGKVTRAALEAALLARKVPGSP
jgi:glutaredoxin